MSEDIYKLKMHEEIHVGINTWIKRVPGGWIYIGYSDDGITSMVFVPFNNEFQDNKDDK